MEFDIKNVHTQATKYLVTKAIARVLHECPGHFLAYPERLPNFEVRLNYQKNIETRNNGTGTFTVTKPIGEKFCRLYRRGEIAVEVNGRTIKFYPTNRSVEQGLALKLERARFIDPDIEQERQKKFDTLRDAFLVSNVQIGIFYYPASSRSGDPRSFSVEWEQDFTEHSIAWLRFEYDHKLVQIEIGDPTTEQTRYGVAVGFDNVRKLAIGIDWGKPYVCFDLLTPPVFEGEQMHRPEGRGRHIHRLTALHPGHAAVAPYAHHLRIVLFHDRDPCEVLDKFNYFCNVAALRPPIRGVKIHANACSFFSPKMLHKVTKWLSRISTLDWRVAFQIEALLRSGVTNTIEVLSLQLRIDGLITRHGALAGEIMRYFVEAAVNRHPAQSLEKCFEANLQRKLRSRQLTTPPGYFFCHRVTFTPTRLLLEGPNITQSNRVIRDFKGYEDFFLRVSFRDEDRLQYRWTRDVNSLHLLQTRVGQTLKQGFDLAGRHFDFLAYSQSALKAHTVWFVSPFYHKEREQWVTAESIRNSLGDFRKDILYPSRYGARIALAFTSTDPSIKIHKDRWSEIPDIKDRGVVFTDGVGTISQELSDMIWTVLCQNYGVRGGNVVQPSAYQIRFLGYKGIVCVDQQLKGIYMCLRESMKKFDVPGKVYADIEIAGVFNKPKTANLNRPLVMVLEDRGAASQAFLDLQEDAVSKTRRVGESAEMFASLLETYNLCGDFRLADILRRLGTLGLGLNPEVTPFFAQLRSCATNHVLRYLKYRARIPIPDSHKLVGVADIGPDYIKKGYENVYCLPPGRIFACIQNSSDEEPKWIRGMCIVSRSPVVHPGDVQRAYAIGKPPADKLCLFSHLRNVVVFPSQGARSLPNSLAGGDLDGDLYEVIQYEPFLIPEHYDPAGYLPAKPFSLGRPSTIEDFCDFIVEYINSDVVGLVAVKHIIIADQSTDGTLDKDCIKLAELHTQAVDYPKNGNKVDTHDLPRELIAFKPDWHAVERSVHHNTDYYESPRALGHLYRNITLEKIPDYPSTAEEYLNDPITKLLHPLVQNQLRGHKCQTDRDWMNTVYMGYREELTYMSTTYSLSKSPLREEQLVAGIILENCSSEVHKKDRVYAMKESLRFLVRDTREELFGIGDLSTDSDKEVRKKMACGWDVWVYSHENAAKNPTAERFGSRSFGLIALGHVLDCLVRLGSLHSQ